MIPAEVPCPRFYKTFHSQLSHSALPTAARQADFLHQSLLGVQKECNVEVDVIPISPMVGSLWIILGEKKNIRLALEYLNGIYDNTIKKNG